MSSTVAARERTYGGGTAGKSDREAGRRSSSGNRDAFNRCIQLFLHVRSRASVFSVGKSLAKLKRQGVLYVGKKHNQ